MRAQTQPERASPKQVAECLTQESPAVEGSRWWVFFLGGGGVGFRGVRFRVEGLGGRG